VADHPGRSGGVGNIKDDAPARGFVGITAVHVIIAAGDFNDALVHGNIHAAPVTDLEGESGEGLFESDGVGIGTIDPSVKPTIGRAFSDQKAQADQSYRQGIFMACYHRPGTIVYEMALFLGILHFNIYNNSNKTTCGTKGFV